MSTGGARTRNPDWKTRALRRSDRELVVQRFKLETITGRDAGSTVAASSPEIGIGTAPGNDLILTDSAVSRHHCVVEATDEGYLLRDLGSTNGTAIGGHKIQVAYLAQGDVISVGESTLRFEFSSEEIHEPLSDASNFGPVLGRSVSMRRIFALLQKVVDSSVTVLITGETGTGKGALAGALHERGARSDNPFVVIDCGAISETLIESEFFGHEKGAFTGADKQHIGAFERAQGGTVFLDEIGELSIDMQPKLLRVLENKEVRRVGGSKAIPVDIRIVAATNRDLRSEVNSGGFREDLFYRLNVMRLELPPLRERRADIPMLVESFYRFFKGDPEASPPAELLSRLLRQRLAGNVRELRATIERAVILGDLAHLPAVREKHSTEALDFTISYRDAKERALRQWERSYVPELLERYDGNMSRAARAVQMDRNHLRKLLKGIEE